MQVALYAAEKLLELGAIPVTFSDSSGHIFEPEVCACVLRVCVAVLVCLCECCTRRLRWRVVLTSALHKMWCSLMQRAFIQARVIYQAKEQIVGVFSW